MKYALYINIFFRYFNKSDIVTIIWVFVSYRRYIYVILFESKKKKKISQSSIFIRTLL